MASVSALERLCFYLTGTDGQQAAAEWEKSYVTELVLAAAHERCIDRGNNAPNAEQGMRALGRIEGITEFRSEVLHMLSAAVKLNEQRAKSKENGLGFVGEGLGALVPTYGADEIMLEEAASLSDMLSRPPYANQGDKNVVAPATVTE